MKAIAARLRRLENQRFGLRREQGPSIADVIREKRCRRLAQERGVPYEQVLREEIIESQALMAGYRGSGKIADVIRYVRIRRLARGSIRGQ